MKKYLKVLVILSLFTFLLVSCGESDDGAKGEADSEPVLELAFEVTGFSGPESALYDSARDVIYVSNVNGEAVAKDGNGFISKIATDGEILEMEWVGELNAPKGQAIFGDMLYVSDIDELVEIDIKAGEVKNRYLAEGSVLLNDVAVDKAGNVYVSDTITSAIYRLQEGKMELWISDAALESPNGLYVESDHLVVASWGVITDPATFGTEVPGHIHTVSLSEKKIESHGEKKPVGNLDGIEADGNGNYFLTDWVKGELLYYKATGEYSTLLKLSMGAADIGYIEKSKTIIIPLTFDGKLVIYHVL